MVLRFGTFAGAGICQPTETGASSAGTLHWPSWRHTSSCLLRKARANTAIFSHMIQSQTTPGDRYRSDPFLPQSRRRFQNSTRATEQSSALPSPPLPALSLFSGQQPPQAGAPQGTAHSLNPCAHSFPQLPATMQSHSARDRCQDPSSCARAAALKERGRYKTRPKKVSDSSGSTTIIHLGKEKLLGSYFFSKNLCISVPGSLLATAVV